MKVAFLVQNNYVLYNSIPVAQYCHRRDHTLIDRSSHSEFDAMNTDVDWSEFDVIFPYGSVQFVRALARSPLARWVHYNFEAFSTASWMDQFGEAALNSSGFKTPASSIPALLETQSFHVRPDSKDKAFVAAAFTVESWAAHAVEKRIEDDLECFVSPIRDIEAEYRCWIVGGQIVDISQYIRDNQLDLERISDQSDVWMQAQTLADIYTPAPMVVMDVVKLRDGGQLFFLEFNCIHSSGWYHGDKDHILDSAIDWLKAQEQLAQ